jgi:pimeloyl-ACP methyl ester carboxylesterase
MKKCGIIIVLVFVVQLAFTQQAITVEKSGEGTPLVFLPGFTSPGSVWNETIENLEGTYQRFTVSYAGFGGLAPIDFPWFEGVKQQLIAYIEKENLMNVTLIGHSMGGNLAIEVAVALPGRIRSLILLESLPCMLEVMMPNVPASSLQYESPYNDQLIAMSDEAFTEVARMMSQQMTNVPSKVAQLTEWAVTSDRKTYVYGYTDLMKLDLREKLSEIAVPTLVIASSSPVKKVVAANLEKQYHQLKNKEILLVDESKHFVMFDQPEWLYAEINKYLKQHAR